MKPEPCKHCGQPIARALSAGRPWIHLEGPATARQPCDQRAAAGTIAEPVGTPCAPPCAGARPGIVGTLVNLLDPRPRPGNPPTPATPPPLA